RSSITRSPFCVRDLSPPTDAYPLSLHDALPILCLGEAALPPRSRRHDRIDPAAPLRRGAAAHHRSRAAGRAVPGRGGDAVAAGAGLGDAVAGTGAGRGPGDGRRAAPVAAQRDRPRDWRVPRAAPPSSGRGHGRTQARPGAAARIAPARGAGIALKTFVFRVGPGTDPSGNHAARAAGLLTPPDLSAGSAAAAR